MSDGRFGLDEYVEHLMQFMDAIGPGAHLMAVCQPCPAGLAAGAILAQDDYPAQPASIIDAEQAPQPNRVRAALPCRCQQVPHAAVIAAPQLRPVWG